MADEPVERELLTCPSCGKEVVCWPAGREGEFIRYRLPACACGKRSDLHGYVLVGQEGAPLMVYRGRSR